MCAGRSACWRAGGLFVHEDRFRKDGGQTSNVYRLTIERPAGGRESADRSNNPTGPPPDGPNRSEGVDLSVRARTPSEPSSSDKEGRADADDSEVRATFGQASKRGEPPALAVLPAGLGQIWRRFAQRISPSRLLAAAPYLREDPDVKRHRSSQRLKNLAAGREIRGVGGKKARRLAWRGASVPRALRDAAIARKGAWVTSWIDPCRYDAATRLLRTKTLFSAKMLSAKLGALLRDLNWIGTSDLAQRLSFLAAAAVIAILALRI